MTKFILSALVGATCFMLTLAQELEVTTLVEGENGDVDNQGEEESEPVYAVLMPWFAQAVGVVAFYLLSRTLHGVPYTLVMFLAGMFMGVGVARSGLEDELSQSIELWRGVNSEVLFAVFLPGLLFKDAIGINFHLFLASFWQLMLLAFPMVLAGAMLTACIGLYIFPYGWSFMLSCTFGSILAATDPVAVAALLNEVGAPPRLKMHISGEALLNDGSAVVFYTVFVASFFAETFGEGQLVSVAEGFEIFFRMSLGGAVVGFAFALALVFILYRLDRRLEQEETVVQVVATVTVAYLSFYTAQVPCKMSGVISVVVCGIVTKAFGGGLIADQAAMSSFWTLLEHLLNTVLFTLAGIEFGFIIADTEHEWKARDWGYLFLLYVLLNVIRFFLFAAFYPLLRSIGTKTNWQEVVFSSWSGLRGAVGITLALGLDSEVRAETTNPDEVVQTYRLFGMVAGVAFLTLLVNGPLAGPLLTRLGLVDSTEARRRIVKAAEDASRRRVLDDFIHLMTDPRFFFVDFALVMHHCPMLRGLTAEELSNAVDQNREATHPRNYQHPNLDHVLPYIPSSEELKRKIEKTKRELFMGGGDDYQKRVTDLDAVSEEDAAQEPAADLVEDIRIMFVELLKASYNAQIRDGELDPREYEGFLSYSLLQSLEFAHENAMKGEPLNDWELSQVVTTRYVDKTEFGKLIIVRLYAWLRFWNRKRIEHQSLSYQHLRLEVLRAFSFIDAHNDAQDRLRAEFGESRGDVMAALRLVLEESKSEVAKAQGVLGSKTKKQQRDVISHLLCTILLNKAARNIRVLMESGVLLPREATEELETIEHHILGIRSCSMSLEEHPGHIQVAEVAEAPGSRRRARVRQNSLLS